MGIFFCLLLIMYLKGKHQAQLIYQLRLKSKEIGDGKGPRTSTKVDQTVKVWAKRFADLITWEKEQKCWISCPLQDHLYSWVFCCYHLVSRSSLFAMNFVALMAQFYLYADLGLLKLSIEAHKKCHEQKSTTYMCDI